jgi:hypothetical protein
MGLLHAGQWDEGNTIDIFAGMRTIQTFKKLPIALPTTNKLPTKIHSDITI